MLIGFHTLRTARPLGLVALAAALALPGCGGPETIIPPPPPQSVNAYWVGIEETGALHLHITFTQTGTSLTLRQDCFVDRCSLYPFSAAGIVAIGNEFPEPLQSVSGTFNNPNISFTFTLRNGRIFSFTGIVAENRLMAGRISGATHQASNITFEKRE